MMNALHKGLLLIAPALALLLSEATAHAGEQHGRIVQLHARRNGFVFFNVVGGEHENRPTCAMFPNMWVLDERPPGFQAQYALLVQAAVARRAVRITGTNECHGGYEYADYVGIQ